MKKVDNGKVSLVEFLSSIKFSRNASDKRVAECNGRFAHLKPRARPGGVFSTEDLQLIRSAN